MNRRDVLKSLIGLPAAASALAMNSGFPGQKWDVKIINACGSCLTPQTFRCALDIFGEDCKVCGHPAQRNAWEMGRLLLGNSAYSPERNEKFCHYFFGDKFTTDNSLPNDIVEFSKNGEIVGVIRCLAIPPHYGKIDG